MALCSRILAWKIPWTEEPGGLQSIGLQRVRHDWAHIHTLHLESGYLPGMRWYQIHNSPEMLQNWKMKDDLWECDLFWGALYQPQKGQWVGCWESTWMSYVTHGPQVIPPEQMQTETSSVAATTKTPGCIHRTCIQLHVCLRVSCPPKGMSLPKVWLPPSQLLPLFQMYCQKFWNGKELDIIINSRTTSLSFLKIHPHSISLCTWVQTYCLIQPRRDCPLSPNIH